MKSITKTFLTQIPPTGQQIFKPCDPDSLSLNVDLNLVLSLNNVLKLKHESNQINVSSHLSKDIW